MRAECTLPEATIPLLPFDLLREVFLIGSQIEVIEPFQTAGHHSLRVSWVSQWWRNIALEIPELWSSIPIEFSSAHSYAQVSEYLKRSKQFPLHLVTTDSRRRDFNTSKSDNAVENQMVVELLQLLDPHIARWRVVESDFTNHIKFHTAFSHIHGVASILESWSIRCTCNIHLTHDYLFPEDFTAPKLSYFSFKALNNLAIHSVNPQHYNTGLETLLSTSWQFPNLTHLQLDGVCSAPTRFVPGWYLPCLTSISFGSIRTSDIFPFFSRGNAPELTTVRFSNISCGPVLVNIFHDMPLFLSRKIRLPRLQHIVFDVTEMPKRASLDILVAPFAQRLTLEFHHGDYSDDDVLMDMAQPDWPGIGWLCPALQFLEVSASSVRPQSLQLVLTSRLHASQKDSPLAPKAIRSLRILGPLSDLWTDEDREWFASNVPDCVFLTAP